MKQLLWINGEHVEGETSEPLFSPYSKEMISEVARASKEQFNEAIQAAHEAFPTFKSIPAFKRAEILEKVVAFLKRDREECARLIAQEAAKPIKTALAEVDRTIMTYTFAAQEARRIYGETIPLDAAPGGEGRVAFTVREPLGVVAAITPFNFPMNLVAHKVGPAIASGNTVVLKPASQTPLSAYRIAHYFHEAGLPKGVLNVVTGSGKIAGEAFVKDERVKMITFTGSPVVGKWLREHAGLKRVTLELGSNSAVIVDEGVNISNIVPRVVTGAFTYQGQVCISVQRIFVHSSLYDSFVDQFVKETKKLTLGNPLHQETDISALISEEEVERIQNWIQEAVNHGARLEYGGKVINRMLQPTVLLNASLSDKISCQEVFGPVVHINRFDYFDEVIEAVNDSSYGLQVGVYTNDVNKAFRASRELHVGGVMINEIPTFRVDHMPYGGVKMSGMGREGIKYAIEEMTEIKLISFKLTE
jgi:acyl-CoA reductase-like NAD-dependent aldehyde dehydrogenase